MRKVFVVVLILAFLVPTCAMAEGTDQCDIPDLGHGGWDVWIGESQTALYLPYNLQLKPVRWSGDQITAIEAQAWAGATEPESEDVPIVRFVRAEGWTVESYSIIEIEQRCPTESEIGIAWATLTTLNGGAGEEWDVFENWWASAPYYHQLMDLLSGKYPAVPYLFPLDWDVTVQYRAGGSTLKICCYGDKSWAGCFSVSTETSRRTWMELPVTLALIQESTLAYRDSRSASSSPASSFAQFGWTPSLEAFCFLLDATFMDSIAGGAIARRCGENPNHITQRRKHT
jgi:hypothetical protein